MRPCKALLLTLLAMALLPLGGAAQAGTCDPWNWPHTEQVPAWWCDDDATYATMRRSGHYPSWPHWWARPHTITRTFETWPEPGVHEVELLWVVWFNDADHPLSGIPPVHWDHWGSFHGCTDPPDWPHGDWGWRDPSNWRRGTFRLESGGEQHELWYCGHQAEYSYGPTHEYGYVSFYWFRGEVTFTGEAPTVQLDIRLPGYVTPDYREVFTRDECRMRIVPAAQRPKFPIDVTSGPTPEAG